VRVFSTCPPSGEAGGERYLGRVADVARWSERWGCAGILVYSDNSLVDPWLVAQTIVQHTESLSPLVAVQPVYMHPYAVAKLVATLGHLYGRRVHLNMTAGGFANDLTALDDATPHDRRYDRLTEYTTILQRLLAGRGPVDFAGDFYRVKKLALRPPLPGDLFPGIFVSGSSPAGLAAARTLRATAVRYPQPPGQEEPDAVEGVDRGIRVGIVAREDGADAWRIARGRFPADRAGQLTHQLAMKVSDSAWHRQLSDRTAEIEGSPYWLGPFQNYRSMCPYLVGSYEDVADALRRYVAQGYRTVILDVPSSEDDLWHASVALSRAVEAPAG
jgi:alkanesulfonate monooxygenase